MAELSMNYRSLVGYMTRSEQHAAHGFDLILKKPAPEIFFDELRRVGLFDPKLNPKPQPVEGKEEFFRIPYWTALKYLTTVAEIAGKSGDTSLGGGVMQVVRSIAEYREGDAYIDNYHTYSELAKIIGRVPMSCVSLSDIDLAKLFLGTRWGNDTIIRELAHAMHEFLTSNSVDDHAKAVRLLGYCTELCASDASDGAVRNVKTVADPFWLEQLLNNNADALGSKGRMPALDCLVSRLKDVFGGGYISENTWLKRSAIEDNEQNHQWDHVVNAFTNATRNALNAWLEVAPESSTNYVEKMLSDGAQIVRRVAINAVRVQWRVLAQSFEQSISPALFDIGHLHEMYLLLREHFMELSERSQTRVLDAIDALSVGVEANAENIERAQHQQWRWLDSVKGLGNGRADEEYARLTAIFGPMHGHPEFLSYHSMGWGVGTGKSPYTQDELLAFAGDKSLIQRVESYALAANELRPSRKSLIDELTKAVQTKPEMFTWTLSVDVQLERPTQYGLIHGFEKYLESLKQNGASSSLRSVLDGLLPYLQGVVGNASFWEEKVEESGYFEPNKNWIPPVIAQIVKTLAANDDISLSDADVQLLLDTILVVKANCDGIGASEDPMTAAINNSRGKAVEAFLQVVLRRCREADKAYGEHVDAWLSFKSAVDTEMRGCCDGRNLESSTLFASYLAQLLYISEDWVKANVMRLFPLHHPDNLVCAIAGLSFANATKGVYASLKEARIPEVVLRMSDIKGSPRERLIERIALAYIWGEERLAEPVINDMFGDNRLDDLVEFSSTISRWSKEKLDEKQTERAKELARAITSFGLAQPDTRKSLLTAASKFAGYVTSPNESDMEWLKFVAPYAHFSHGEDDFLEVLEKMATEDAKRTLDVFEIFLRDYEISNDFRGRLESIIRKLNSGGLHLQVLGLVEQLVRKGGGSKWVGLYTELFRTQSPLLN